MRRGRTAALAALLLAGMLSACTLTHSRYERPALAEVAAYDNTEMFPRGDIAPDFYRAFGDEHLTAAVEAALERNHSMQSAYLSVLSALAALGIEQAALHPTAEATLGTQSSRALDRHEHSQRASSGGLSLSYVIDLFGRLAAARRGAFEEFRASAYDYLAMRLSTIASTALAYYEYVYSYEAMLLGIQDVLDSRRRLDIIRYRFTLGAVEGLDYDQAMVDHLNVLQTLNSRYNAYDLAHNALTTMMGRTPDQVIGLSSLDRSAIPVFGTDVPARLLARRPDLMAAEARIRSALSARDQSTLSFFPEITLSAGITTGSSGVLFERFLANPVGTLGAAAAFPFLSFNELRWQRTQAGIALEQARLDFVNAYIVAVQEVFDALSTVRYDYQLVLSARREYALTRSNYDRYLEKYRMGSSPLSDLLDAADALRSASISLLAAKRDSLVSCVDLMAALGGDTTEDSVRRIDGVGDPGDYRVLGPGPFTAL